MRNNQKVKQPKSSVICLALTALGHIRFFLRVINAHVQARGRDHRSGTRAGVNNFVLSDRLNNRLIEPPVFYERNQIHRTAATEVENAVLRELKEETSIEATIDRFLYRLSYYDDGSEHQFYLCRYVSGEPRLSEDSNEKKEMESSEEFYEPMWVKLSELKNLKIYPPEVPGWILRDFSDFV